MTPKRRESVERLREHCATLRERVDSQRHEASGGLSESVDPLELMDHFFRTTDCYWIGSPGCQRILQQHGPRLALRSPYLLHAMLANSAYHLASLKPAMAKYGLAGISHYSKSLELYMTPIRDDIATMDVDALFASCMLLNLIAFKNNATTPSGITDPTSQDDFAMDIAGLRSIRGFRILKELPSLQSKLDQSIWSSFFNECGSREPRSTDVYSQSFRRLEAMDGLDNLCSSQMSQTVTDGRYDSALDSLRRLMYRGPGHETIGVWFRFGGALETPFLQLVESKDTRALLLLCYWYTMAAQIQQWWAADTARLEGSRLLKFLQNYSEPQVVALLWYPSEILETSATGDLHESL